MLEAYHLSTKIYHNNLKMYEGYNNLILLDPEDAQNKVLKVNWKNFTQYRKQYGSFYWGYDIQKKAMGYVLCPLNGDFLCKDARTIKQWKHDLNLTIEIYYEPFTPSLKSLWTYDNCHDAITYLRQHDFSILDEYLRRRIINKK